MTVRVYRWDDASAPVLNGTAGSFIALLDACLVNGYGSKPSSGWTKPFSGTNLAAYRMPSGTNQHYLRIDDTTTTYCVGRGYETMSDVNTGTGDFPTAAKMANGVYYIKSSTADSVAREWVLIVSAGSVWLHINYANAAGAISGVLYFFGKIGSYKPADGYDTAIIGNTGTSYSNTAMYSGSSNFASAALAGHWLARSHTQTGGSIGFTKGGDVFKQAGSSNFSSNGASYPDPVTGGLLMTPVYIGEPAAVVTRGVLPGAWALLHNKPLTHLDTFSGTGAMAGKTFLYLYIYAGTVFCIETSDTW